jgi:hypothetical protein
MLCARDALVILMTNVARREAAKARHAENAAALRCARMVTATSKCHWRRAASTRRHRSPCRWPSVRTARAIATLSTRASWRLCTAHLSSCRRRTWPSAWACSSPLVWRT